MAGFSCWTDQWLVTSHSVVKHNCQSPRSTFSPQWTYVISKSPTISEHRRFQTNEVDSNVTWNCKFAYFTNAFHQLSIPVVCHYFFTTHSTYEHFQPLFKILLHSQEMEPPQNGKSDCVLLNRLTKQVLDFSDEFQPPELMTVGLFRGPVCANSMKRFSTHSQLLIFIYR